MAREPVVASKPKAAEVVRTASITLCIEASMLLNEQRIISPAHDRCFGVGWVFSYVLNFERADGPVSGLRFELPV
jgi:hypothetical protein